MSKTPLIDIHPDHWAIVQAILQKHVPQHEVWAFGSRAKWLAKEYSDLDLAIITDKALPLDVYARLSDDFSESDLPFRVDIVDWATTSESFRKIIERDKVVVQHGKNSLGIGGEWQRYEVKALIDAGVLFIGDGYRAKNEELAPSGLPFARAGNINNGFQFDGADHFPEANLFRVGNKISRPGDVVFTSKGTVGRFAFVRANTPRFVYSPQLCFWRSLNKDRIDPRFLYFWMHGREFFVQFKGVAGQTDMAEYVSLSDQRKMHITLPSVQEQRAIALILGTLDDKIELLRRQNETLEAMARALFKAWFVDFEPVRAKMEGRWQRGQSLPGLPAHLYDLFPDRLVDSELGEIPEGWRHSTIGKEVTVCGGSTPSTKEPEFWEGGQHCWATPKDLSSLKFPVLLDTDRKITDAGLAKISSGLLPVGTVLLSSRAPIGYLAIAEVPTAINQGFIAMKCDGALPNVYVLLWCRESMDAIVGNANGSTFQEISKSNFRPLRVVVPSAPVLTSFTSPATSLYRQLAENERESRTLAALRDTLLPKLIAGELRVKDAEAFLKERGL